MDLTLWFPALTATALFAAALWLGRNVISTRLTKSVEHEFNTKLESIKAQIRESEERLKAELRSKEAEIAALRSGALTALASRQMALDKRRLEAIDQIWASVIALGPARGIATLMSSVSFEKAAPRSGSVCLNNFPRTISGALGVHNSAELSTVADGACDVLADAVGNSGRTNNFHSMRPLPVWAG